MTLTDESRQLKPCSSPYRFRYGRWTIEPSSVSYMASTDWSFVHDDYDGAEDAHDSRHGYGRSVQDCINQIEEEHEGT
jgi:hypothetical protein